MGARSGRPGPDPRPKPSADELRARAYRTDDGCLISTWSRPRRGYVQVGFEGRQDVAHRLMWEAVHGPIPSDMQVDHQCHNVAAELGECAGGPDCVHRGCIEIEHLRLIDLVGNVMASAVSVSRRNLAKTHCPQGHPLHGDNVYVVPKTGWRQCRECKKASNRKYDRTSRRSPTAGDPG